MYGSGTMTLNSDYNENSTKVIEQNFGSPAIDVEERDKAIATNFKSRQIDFDFKGASESYTPSQIVEHLSTRVDAKKFNFEEARKSYSDEDIIKHLTTRGINRTNLRDENGEITAVPDYIGTDGSINDRLRESLNQDKDEVNRRVALVEAQNSNIPIDDEARATIEQDVKDNYNPYDFGLGAEKFIQGAKATILDILDVTGATSLVGDGAVDRAKGMSAEVTKAVEDIDKSIKDKSFFSKATAGELTPAIATLPVSATSKLAVFAAEGAIGYVTSKGDVNSEGQQNSTNEALVDGVIAGALGVGAVKVGELIAKSFGNEVSSEVSDHFIKKLQLEGKVAKQDEIFAQYQKLTDAKDTTTNRMISFIEYAGKQGKAIKQDLASTDPKAVDLLNKQQVDRLDQVSKEISKIDITAKDFGAKLGESFKIAKDSYSGVKDTIQDSIGTTKFTIPEAFDEIATDHAVIKSFMKNKTFSTHDIVDIMPHVNASLHKAKGVHKHNWAEFKKALDDELVHLPSDQYAKWKVANKQYSDYLSLNKKVMDSQVNKWADGEINGQQFIKALTVDQNSQFDTLSNIRTMLGDKEVANFEKLLIKDAMGSTHFDDLVLTNFAKDVSKGNFVSKEGKQLQTFIKEVAETFRTDSQVSKLMDNLDRDNSGRSTNLLIKMATSLADRVYKSTIGRFTKQQRMDRGLLEAFAKNPNTLKDLQRVMNDNANGIVLQEARNVITRWSQKGNNTDEPLSPPKPFKRVYDPHARRDTNLASWVNSKVVNTIEGVDTKSLNSDTVKSWANSLKADDIEGTDIDVNGAIGALVDTFEGATFRKHLQVVRDKFLRGRSYQSSNAVKELTNSSYSEFISKVDGVTKSDYEKMVSNYFNNVTVNNPPKLDQSKGIDKLQDIPNINMTTNDYIPAKSSIERMVKDKTVNDKDKTVIDYIVKHESGGDYNAKNPNSTARGKYQVIDSTRKWVAGKLGISDKYSSTPQGQELVMEYLTRSYKEQLVKLGKDINKENMYTIHQLGAGRANRFFKDKLTAKDIKVMRANIPKDKQTSKMTKYDVLKVWSEIYRGE